MASFDDPATRRERLRDARLMLLFTPSLCGTRGGNDARDPLSSRDALDVLDAALPHVDVVQVRIKAPGEPSHARDVHDWTERVLALVAARPTSRERVLVIVDDCVDVAAVLAARGCAGVHVGQDDLPAEEVRRLLDAQLLVGVSTHDMQQVALAEDAGADYLGFGPVHATATKGYERGLGAEAAWIAQSATPLPVFPIGGIALENANELAQIGRAAVSSAILGAADPARAARELRELLADDDG
ncbi:MAG: thiamine phosphate synthase [Planctomycetota bacterium]|nr:MAG: thiamine phosphate synthase [Planctomycetota bacterium]